MKRLITAVAIALCGLMLTACGTAVPDVTGMSLEDATSELTSAGFVVGEAVYDEEADGAQWTVSTQEPAPGKRAGEGSVVQLTIVGPPPVEVPDLSGLDQGGAAAAVEAVGLTLGEVTQSYDASIPVSILLSQEPSAGVVVGKGSSVAAVFSKGPEPVTVPSVLGMAETAARETLEGVGLGLTVAQEHDSAAKGTVIGQAPAEGSVLPGSIVAITVSKGPELVTVPNIYGMLDPDGLLRSRGLVPKGIAIHGPIEPDAADIGQAYRQSPKAGSQVPRGTTVTYHFWWEAS